MNNLLPLLYLGSILFGIMLLMGMNLYKAGRKTPADSQQSLIQMQNTRQRLVQEIARLDDRYAAGRIHPADYDAERGRKKRKLIEVTLRCNRQS